MTQPDVSALCEEIGRKANAWAETSKIADKIAQRTTNALGQALVLEFAIDAFAQGLFRGLCDSGLVFNSLAGAGKKPWRSLPYAQQAAMRCGEPDFQKFMAARDDAHAAELVRARCGVASRRELTPGTAAGDKWEAIEGDYFAWQRGGGG
jgi:hypothetical protein